LDIVIVAHAFPPYIGGLSYVVENISTRLAAKGFNVEVVTLDVDGGLPREEVYRGVYVKRFRGYAPDGGYFIPSIDFYRYLKSREADVFHLHNIGALTVPAAYMALRSTGRSYVVTPHYHRSGYKWHAKVLWRLYRPIARRILRGAGVVHCVSSYEASLVREVFGVDGIIIPNGVSEDVLDYRWSPPSGGIVVTYAGRLEKYKRVDLVVKTAAILKQRGFRDVVVKIIGRGPDLERIMSVAEELGVEVTHLGFLPRPRYLEELSKSTVFVDASQYEAYSVVSAEANAMGVPTVVVEPWGQHFKGLRNVFIAEPSPGAIANAVEDAVKNSVEEGSSSQRLLQVPSWNTVVERLVNEVYSRIAKR